MEKLKYAKELLINDNYTCVIYDGYNTYTSSQRGVKPLYLWYTQGLNFKGYAGADRVIGKATAYLYILLNIEAIYTKVISKSALKILLDNHIKVEYDELVDNIINRKGDGICPFEETVMEINDKDEAYKAIKKKLIDMNLI